MMMNSSPPSRASVSGARMAPLRLFEMCWSTSSPTSWPCESLMSLKPFRSSISRAVRVLFALGLLNGGDQAVLEETSVGQAGEVVVKGVPLVTGDLVLQHDQEHADGDEKISAYPRSRRRCRCTAGRLVTQEWKRNTSAQTVKPRTIAALPRLFRGRLSWKTTAVER